MKKKISNIELDRIYNEDCLSGLRRLPDNVVDCVVTSPPYFALRDYGVDGQIGLEDSPEAYIGRLCDIFHYVLRSLSRCLGQEKTRRSRKLDVEFSEWAKRYVSM